MGKRRRRRVRKAGPPSLIRGKMRLDRNCFSYKSQHDFKIDSTAKNPFCCMGLHKYAKRALAKHGCFTLRVRLVFHPTGVTIKVASHGREIGAVPLEPRDKPLVLPMRRLRTEYLCKLMHNYYFLQWNQN